MMTNAQEEEMGKIDIMAIANYDMLRGDKFDEIAQMKEIGSPPGSMFVGTMISEPKRMKKKIQTRRNFGEVFLWETFEFDTKVDQEKFQEESSTVSHVQEKETTAFENEIEGSTSTTIATTIITEEDQGFVSKLGFG